ncbi:uncharacterized protein SPPG_01657 [Spizellomyces punctatus DAOM BR117]|uniref:Uncharacterized protein n=1 Tax=Spizellomyces punctatus (strain DAOM BR117) TaxID=645134 RepID=A0A0L0HTJ9_SPIPD|nr:uncharacterized protein SPPG_01657 [Spizellomyces punctatus DAOM BR117]KND04225.1 hypothetical protein SPPG_01657 [Spizellomyces punctatus DAOM BR117]|eukprot:XP_016612264.1 hypothetical protein SPPG_01657 [Spizellomyces punctatus DAOM BR117]
MKPIPVTPAPGEDVDSDANDVVPPMAKSAEVVTGKPATDGKESKGRRGRRGRKKQTAKDEDNKDEEAKDKISTSQGLHDQPNDSLPEDLTISTAPASQSKSSIPLHSSPLPLIAKAFDTNYPTTPTSTPTHHSSTTLVPQIPNVSDLYLITDSATHTTYPEAEDANYASVSTSTPIAAEAPDVDMDDLDAFFSSFELENQSTVPAYAYNPSAPPVIPFPPGWDFENSTNTNVGQNQPVIDPTWQGYSDGVSAGLDVNGYDGNWMSSDEFFQNLDNENVPAAGGSIPGVAAACGGGGMNLHGAAPSTLLHTQTPIMTSTLQTYAAPFDNSYNLPATTELWIPPSTCIPGAVTMQQHVNPLDVPPPSVGEVQNWDWTDGMMSANSGLDTACLQDATFGAVSSDPFAEILGNGHIPQQVSHQNQLVQQPQPNYYPQQQVPGAMQGVDIYGNAQWESLGV